MVPGGAPGQKQGPSGVFPGLGIGWVMGGPWGSSWASFASCPSQGAVLGQSRLRIPHQMRGSWIFSFLRNPHLPLPSPFFSWEGRKEGEPGALPHH